MSVNEENKLQDPNIEALPPTYQSISQEKMQDNESGTKLRRKSSIIRGGIVIKEDKDHSLT